MATLAAWRPATAYAKGATVRPNAAQGSVPVALVNGNFEAGDTAWTKDAGWAISTGSAYEGTWKAIYTGTGAGTIKASGTYAATAGQIITATIKAKVLDAADGATAFLKWYDASNVLISTTTGLESSVETGVWMQLSVVSQAPANAAFVVFGVEATRTVGASVAIDDARWDYSAPIEARRMAYRAAQDTAGVSGVVEPTWPTTLGARVTDGTVIWEAVQLDWIEWTARPIIESGVTEPAWPTTVGGFVSDGTTNWEAVSRRVEDENCPQSKVVAIIASKVFAEDADIVRFCATANPLDWTTREDAGYLPTGLQQSNANNMAVLQPYRGNLGCWNANVFQMWQVDPDPTNMALLDQMDGVGSTHTLAATAVGNDLYYLAAPGVRSVGIANAAENLQAGDVGMPIDVLVQAAMAQSVIDGTKALSTYWPGMGQYWLTFGDDGQTAGAGGALRLICAPPAGELGADYTYTYTATGGTAPYTFSVVSGTLPPGLSLDEDTGVLSGIPTEEGSFSFGIQVMDDIGVVAYCGWASEVVEDEVEIEEGVARFLGTGRSSTGFRALSRPMTIGGVWLGSADDQVTPTTSTSVVSMVRYGDYMVSLVQTDSMASTMRLALTTNLSSWATGATPESTGAALGSFTVSGSRLFNWRTNSSTIHYIDSPAAGSFTAGPTLSGGGLARPVALAGNGGEVLAADANGALWGSTDNGTTFTKRVEANFDLARDTMDVNGSRFVVAGDSKSTVYAVAYFTDDNGVSVTASTWPLGAPDQTPGNLVYCGGNDWLLACLGTTPGATALYHSYDNGASFLPVTLPANLYFDLRRLSIAADKATGRVVIAGKEYGTNAPHYYRTDDFGIWTEISRTPTESAGIAAIYPPGSPP